MLLVLGEDRCAPRPCSSPFLLGDLDRSGSGGLLGVCATSRKENEASFFCTTLERTGKNHETYLTQLLALRLLYHHHDCHTMHFFTGYDNGDPREHRYNSNEYVRR